ncbi:MAG: tetratricopeptide repeat protein [Chthoniobacterales bacterium]
MNLLRLCLVLLMGMQLASAITADTFATANEAYNKRDFGSAIQTYETLVRRGEYRPEIFYNLGLAYEKSANPAHAILSYERALLLAPGFADAQLRLDSLSGVPSHWWERLPRLGSRLSVIAIAVASWIFLLSLVAQWRVLGGTRHLWSMTAILSLLALVIAATSFYLRDWPLASPDRAIVLKNEKLRSNFTASSPSILALRPGQAVEITSVNGPWTECRLPDQTLGWIASESLERVVPRT